MNIWSGVLKFIFLLKDWSQNFDTAHYMHPPEGRGGGTYMHFKCNITPAQATLSLWTYFSGKADCPGGGGMSLEVQDESLQSAGLSLCIRPLPSRLKGSRRLNTASIMFEKWVCD